MDASLIVKYWVEVLFSFVVTLLTLVYKFLYGKLKATRQEQDNVKNGITALLRDRIFQAYRQHRKHGYCSIYELDNVNQMYKEYQALGGNGTITQIVEELQQLPREKITQ